MTAMRLVVAGAGGRMGRTLVKAITESKDFELAGAGDHKPHGGHGLAPKLGDGIA